MKIPKELSVDGNLNTDKTMAKRKRTKVQITIYKTILSIVAMNFLNYIPIVFRIFVNLRQSGILCCSYY
jgi:hypothetical protein